MAAVVPIRLVLPVCELKIRSPEDADALTVTLIVPRMSPSVYVADCVVMNCGEIRDVDVVPVISRPDPAKESMVLTVNPASDTIITGVLPAAVEE